MITFPIRCFRLKCRNTKTKKITNQRDYIGLDNLQKFGKETWERYNRTSYTAIHVGELYESINGKWELLSTEQVSSLWLTEK